jgi:AP-1 complex subunit beta-1
MTGYFANSTRGEIPELQKQLNSTRPEKKREAVKKVIAAMTVGKDVSSLFAPVIKCMVTTDIELKKLVYLYIINYAKSQPELAILAVNAIRNDARQRASPLVRALAVRTMGCIRVQQITEYLCEPLNEALRDEDPYVRKTAAVCVAKLFDIAPDLVQDHEIIERLKELLSDGNAAVVANTIAAICEIQETKGKPIVELNAVLVNKVLTALNECTEWGQVYILDYVVAFTPADSREAESVIERVVPRLAHSNPAVVLSAVKVVMKYMDFLTSAELIRSLSRKLAPSLVSLLGAEPEIQYIALRNINLIVQKRPNLLEKDIRIFFCKYNDPIYVKMEKLDIMIRLVDPRNVDLVLHELKEYATEVDVDFVRKAVRAVGSCAIKLDVAAERCIAVLMELIHLKMSYVVQEAVIVIRDVFRKYPNRYEMIIKDLFGLLDTLDNPEAKASMVWIIGEYAERIEDADAQLASFIDGFTDECLSVQLQILTATTKLFLKKPEEGEALIMNLFKVATEEVLHPDLRDRAYVYWRLLSSDPEIAKQVVLAEKPTISDFSYSLETGILDKLIESMPSLASVYHKPAEAIVVKVREHVFEEVEEEPQGVEFDSTGIRPGEGGEAADLLINDLDLLEIGEDTSSSRAKVPLQEVLARETESTTGTKGLKIDMAFNRELSRTSLTVKLLNCSDAELSGWAIQLNVNSFGISYNEPMEFPPVAPGASHQGTLYLSTSATSTQEPPSVPFYIQIALKCSLGIFYFQAPCMLTALLTEDGSLDPEQFKSAWRSVADSQEVTHSVESVLPALQSIGAMKSRLEMNNIFTVAERSTPDQEVLFCSCKTTAQQVIVCELRLSVPTSQLNIACRTTWTPLAALLIQAVNFLLSTSL